ncbi:MAG: acyltransferase [Magnetospirillum sp.]|nr:acyltransferase [Magnetospirillum sp.]
MRFSVLDGWRGVCALVVALHHLHADSHLFPLPFLRHSWMFVDFFFVLSGFVIAHAYGKRLTGPAELGRFVRRRFARLWPLHAAVLAAMVALEGAKALAMSQAGIVAHNPPFSGETSWPAVASNLALVHALGLHDVATWNFPSWSISTEFNTYILFGLVALAGLARRGPILLAVSVAGFAVVAAFSREYLHTIEDFSLFRCVYGFFLGALVHHLVTPRLGWRLPAAGLLEASVVGLVVAFIAAVDREPPSLAAPLVFAAVVAVFAFEQGFLSRLLAGGPAQALGQWSYSIYMIHTLLLVALGRAVNLAEKLLHASFTAPIEVNGQTRVLLVLNGPWGGDALALTYLATVVGLSALTYRWVEMPGRRWLGPR